MLKIALMANNYAEAVRFAEAKFAGKVQKYDKLNSVFYLVNGDVIYLCHNNQDRNVHRGMDYDAFIIHPAYETLFDVVRYRASRI